MRIVSGRIKSGMIDEFKSRYRAHVMPILQAQSGCRGVFLALDDEYPDHMSSVTVWDREEDAVRYEISGEYARALEAVEDTFSEIYQWKLASGGDEGEGIGGVLDVSGYNLVSSKRF